MQLAGSVFFLLSCACGLDSSYAWRSNCQLFLHHDTDLMYWVNSSSHPDWVRWQRYASLFFSFSPTPQETRSKFLDAHEICTVALQTCAVLDRSLFPKVESLEIYLPDDVTVKRIDFFVCSWQFVRNALVHSCEQLKFGCDIMCLCLHFNTYSDEKFSPRHFGRYA